MQITRANNTKDVLNGGNLKTTTRAEFLLKNRFNGEYCIINRLKTVQIDDLESQGPNTTKTGTCEKCMKTLEGIEENIDRKKLRNKGR